MKRSLFGAAGAIILTACGGGGMPSGDGGTVMCGPGTVDDGGFCLIADASNVVCGTGTHLQDAMCVPDVTDAGSTDGGLEPSPWAANQRVAPAAMQISAEPQMAVDSMGNLFVAMMAVTPGGASWSVHLYRSTDGGMNWTERVSHEPGGSGDFLGDVTVAVDHTDRVYFGYIHYLPQMVGTRTDLAGELMVQQSADGLTFAAAQQVSAVDTTNEFNDRPWLSPARDGSMYVSWTNGPADFETGAGIGARYARSQNGQDFSTQQTIFNPMTGSAQLEESPLAFDAMGGLVAISSATQYDFQGNLTSTVYAWNVVQGQWGTVTIANLLAERHFTFETYPIIASDSHGVVYALYLNGISRRVTPYVTRSIDGGNTWSPAIAVLGPDQPGSTAALPWITVDERDRVHVMWLDNRTTHWQPYTSNSPDGVTFGRPERIGDVPFDELNDGATWIGDFLSIVSHAGRRYAVWTDAREGVSQVYFSSAPAP